MRKTFTDSQDSVTQEFGERLAQERREKAARERRDISQKDVAEAVGSTAPSVSRWENGGSPPGDAMLRKLAAYFGVTPGWLRYGQLPREYPVVADAPPVHPSIHRGTLAEAEAKEREIQERLGGKGKKAGGSGRSSRRA